MIESKLALGYFWLIIGIIVFAGSLFVYKLKSKKRKKFKK
jgi:uncharacterized membrane protein YgdD (TMEM256/DUF423 family)